MFGQLPDFTNSYEFLRKLWASGSGMPSGLMPGLSAMTPPMDLEGIDKRIHDLKAVESWLQLNSSLLRTTIQGLEVQRATLVALQTFGSALSPDAMQSAMENVARAASAPSAAPHHQYGAAETVSEAQADAENDEPADDDIDAPPESGAEASAGGREDVVNFVLKPPRKEEQQAIDEAIDRCIGPLGTLARGESERAMMELHTGR